MLMGKHFKLVKTIRILLFIITILSLGIIFLYPTKSTVLGGIQYHLISKECTEDLSLAIEPDKYKFSKEKEEYIVNQKLYDRYDTSFYFEKISKYDNRIDIYITTLTKWKFLRGDCVVNVMIDNVNNKRGYTYILNKPIIVDDMGKQVRYAQIGADASNFLIISFTEEEFYKHRHFTIWFNKYNHLYYELKVRFI